MNLLSLISSWLDIIYQIIMKCVTVTFSLKIATLQWTFGTLLGLLQHCSGVRIRLSSRGINLSWQFSFGSRKSLLTVAEKRFQQLAVAEFSIPCTALWFFSLRAATDGGWDLRADLTQRRSSRQLRAALDSEPLLLPPVYPTIQYSTT